MTHQEIKNDYQLVIFYGNYSRNHMMKGCVPCPGIGLKRLMSKHFIIIEVDEYLTSRLHYQRLERMTNLQVRKGNHCHQIHKILTLIEEPARRIYVNRDHNVCRNILNLGLHYLSYQERIKEFRR